MHVKHPFKNINPYFATENVKSCTTKLNKQQLINDQEQEELIAIQSQEILQVLK